MSDEELVHLASIVWERGKWAGYVGKYSREHTWHLAGGAKLKASDSPFMLPEGYRDSARLDPEKLFVASVASSHMLYWLHIAFGMQIDVMGYVDEARGMLTQIGDGVYWVSEIILQPKITYGPKRTAAPAAEARLHELAQEQCFIANSIKTQVTVRRAEAT
jgi:organic hydroperoxide reductase OsmC/OhrA